MTVTGRRALVLCADDYAMTGGVSRAILQLAAAGRLSATSAMTTSPHWPSHAKSLAAYRDRTAVGLHVDLTMGPPLGALPALAPAGKLPRIPDLARQALAGTLDREEIATEIDRQVEAFVSHLGHDPDFVDGHEHVHALPQVRDALLDVLARRFGGRPLLIRDPCASVSSILARRRGVPKALALHWLSRGFGARVRTLGFVSNDSFAGISTFAPEETRADFAHALEAKGPLALVMCHPGFPDAELASRDPVTERRRTEYDLLMSDDPFIGALWHPDRAAGGPPVDWRRVREAFA